MIKLTASEKIVFDKMDEIERLRREMSLDQAMRKLGISRAVYYKTMKKLMIRNRRGI